MTIAEQRRSPRYSTDWAAQYRYHHTEPWRACRIIDVSFDGAAIELYETTSNDPVEGRFHLQVCSIVDGEAGVSVDATLRRHVEPPDGRLIVGIEFAALAPMTRNLLQLLVRLRTSA